MRGRSRVGQRSIAAGDSRVKAHRSVDVIEVVGELRCEPGTETGWKLCKHPLEVSGWSVRGEAMNLAGFVVGVYVRPERRRPGH